MANVIELIFKLRDGVTAPLNALKGRIGSVLKFGAGIGGVVGIAAAFSKVVASTREAEEVLSNFNLAYKNLGGTVGKTREEMLKFADQQAKFTIFDDESILKAQATLLRFRSVTGETFDRARTATLDLASVMKIDLSSAAEIVGRAIERPSIALRQLRQVGVIFSADQEKVIKRLEATGERAKAAGILLNELEKKIKGAASAAANTLSGAMQRAKNAFDNLFEANQESTSGLTNAFNKLADTFNDPKIIEGIQNITAALIDSLGTVVKLLAKSQEFADFVGRNVAKVVVGESDVSLKALQEELAHREEVFFQVERRGFPEEIAAAKQRIETLKQHIALLKELHAVRTRAGSNRRGGDRGVSSTDDTVRAIQEGEIAAEAAQQAHEEALEADSERWSLGEAVMSDYWEEVRTNIDDTTERILAQDQIFRDAEEARLEALDKLKNAWTPVEQAMRDFTESFSSNLADAISQGGYHGLTTLREILQQTLRGMLADILRSKIKEALLRIIEAIEKRLQAMAQNVGVGNGGSSFWSFLGFGGSGHHAIPGRAGGGRIPPQGAWVGESGMEYVRGDGTVYNAQTMRGIVGAAFGGTTFAPRSTMVFHGDFNEKARAVIFDYVNRKNEETQRFMLRVLERNGVRRPV